MAHDLTFRFVAPCYFGLESAAAFDFKHIGATDVQVTDGRVAFSGGADILAAANLWSRTAERVMILLASFPAATFDELFDGVFAVPWEDYLPKSAKFPVKGSSLSSTLSSVPACQRIVKKAIVERLKKGHHTNFLPETGDEYGVRIALRKDVAEVFLDTSGAGLHKRGYRKTAGAAPLKETIAAAMADFGRVKRASAVQDPFCGSGTLVIEAALKALNIAPGLTRAFAAEKYAFLPKGVFPAAREAALAEKRDDSTFAGAGFDCDPDMVALAAHNAKTAGVSGRCRFEQADVATFRAPEGSIVLANPPYGERMMEKSDAARLAGVLGKALEQSPVHSAYIITADDEFERHFGRRATKRRKVYNGMIPCMVYMYY